MHDNKKLRTGAEHRAWKIPERMSRSAGSKAWYHVND